MAGPEVTPQQSKDVQNSKVGTESKTPKLREIQIPGVAALKPSNSTEASLPSATKADSPYNRVVPGRLTEKAEQSLAKIKLIEQKLKESKTNPLALMEIPEIKAKVDAVVKENKLTADRIPGIAKIQAAFHASKMLNALCSEISAANSVERFRITALSGRNAGNSEHRQALRDFAQHKFDKLIKLGSDVSKSRTEYGDDVDAALAEKDPVKALPHYIKSVEHLREGVQKLIDAPGVDSKIANLAKAAAEADPKLAQSAGIRANQEQQKFQADVAERVAVVRSGKVNLVRPNVLPIKDAVSAVRATHTYISGSPLRAGGPTVGGLPDKNIYLDPNKGFRPATQEDRNIYKGAIGIAANIKEDATNWNDGADALDKAAANQNCPSNQRDKAQLDALSYRQLSLVRIGQAIEVYRRAENMKGAPAETRHQEQVANRVNDLISTADSRIDSFVGSLPESKTPGAPTSHQQKVYQSSQMISRMVEAQAKDWLAGADKAAAAAANNKLSKAERTHASAQAQVWRKNGIAQLAQAVVLSQRVENLVGAPSDAAHLRTHGKHIAKLNKTLELMKANTKLSFSDAQTQVASANQRIADSHTR